MKHILVVEDDQMLLRTISAILESRGYKVSQAKNGKEALGRISDTSFDLVLTDIMLPYSNGLEIISKLNDQEHKTATIIISSAHSEESIQDGFAMGVDDYIRKPFTPSELILRISRLI